MAPPADSPPPFFKLIHPLLIWILRVYWIRRQWYEADYQDVLPQPLQKSFSTISFFKKESITIYLLWHNN
jgi:hypothetical protein